MLRQMNATEKVTITDKPNKVSLGVVSPAAANDPYRTIEPPYIFEKLSGGYIWSGIIIRP
jgi:hypothetical protein